MLRSKSSISILDRITVLTLGLILAGNQFVILNADQTNDCEDHESATDQQVGSNLDTNAGASLGDKHHTAMIPSLARSLSYRAKEGQKDEQSCSSRQNESLHGHCVPANSCNEAFEANLDTCQNTTLVGSSKEEAARRTVCCLDNTISPDRKSTYSHRNDPEYYLALSQIELANGLGSRPKFAYGEQTPKKAIESSHRSLESKSKQVEPVLTFRIPKRETFNDDGRQSLQSDKHQDKIEVIFKKFKKNGDKKQQPNLNIDLATGQMAKFGFNDKRLIQGVRYMDALYDSISKSKLGPLLARLQPELSRYGLEFICQAEPKCQKRAHFRSLDGSCNNVDFPLLGRANTAYDRLMLPSYDDGLQAIHKRAVQGGLLPLVRQVSLTTFKLGDAQGKVLTQLGSYFAQFISHDMTFAALEFLSFQDPSAVDCCNAVSSANVACDKIKVPSDDSFYGQFKKCLNYLRTLQAPPVRSACKLGPREQMSVVTHWLDLSLVYDNDVGQSKQLRNVTRGLLTGRLMDITKGGESFLPEDNKSSGCQKFWQLKNFKPQVPPCFKAGDLRVNQTPYLAILHTIFLRLHNKLAMELAKLNKHWNSERLYQEARRVNIAIYQNIVYRELLPLLLSSSVMEQFKLTVKTGLGHTRVYNSTLGYGACLNEFAHAAYRIHGLVWGMFRAHKDSGESLLDDMPLWMVVNKATLLYKQEMFMGSLNMMLKDTAGHWDSSMPQDIHGRMFQKESQMVGHDLLALDIQRGRDHGLPSYAKVHQACGLGQLRQWGQLEKIMLPGATKKLRMVYAHLQDIDLVVGGQLERPMPGSIIGSTLACLIAEQFRRSRYGDAYFYDNYLQPYPFSAKQLKEIKSVTMASVLCHTTKLKHSQKFAFVASNFKQNKLINCKIVPFIRLEAWRYSTSNRTSGSH